MKPTLEKLAHLTHSHDVRLFAGIMGGIVLLIGVAVLILYLRRPSPEELERRRREELANNGRITDGIIVDARSLTGGESVSATPEVLLYTYQLAGVTYNCGQDVSQLADLILGFRLDQAVQVRYDRRNPGNSIIVSESWSGLWMRGQ